MAKDKGRLLQVKTGEGKSTTVGIIAAFKALQGQKVDIITSAESLAARDAKEGGKFYNFYKALGLSCDHNSFQRDKPDYSKEKGRICYQSDIVYGTTHQFVADILQDEYSEQGTLGDRKSEVVIVDEVDNMLIDNQSTSTMLSRETPGLENLRPLLQYIWTRVTIDSQRLNQNFEGEIESDDGYVCKIKNEENFAIYLEEQIEERIQKNDLVKLNKYLHQYSIKMTPKWVRNAIQAKFRQQNKVHYIIRDGQVKIIDLNNGIEQENMQWQDGLHQFLQLKEGLRVTPESLCTNFMSYVTFYLRYKNNIFGLTGTLGSVANQQFLNETYSVDIGFIPQFKASRFQRMPAILKQSDLEQLESIIQSIATEIQNMRAVLVICESIQDVEMYKLILEQRKISNKIIVYYEKAQDIETSEIESQTVIIATNLAGRGTDVQVSQQVEENGGLHVIVTYLPPNSRIEEQALGRTARCGKNGTGQLIINLTSENITRWFPTQQQQLQMYINEEILLKLRDYIENQVIKYQEKRMRKVIQQDQMFREYCNCISSQYKNQSQIFQDIEDRFALWLKIHEDDTDEEKLKEFEIFKKETQKELISNMNEYKYQNPYYCALAAMDEISKKNYQAGLQLAQKCQKDDPFNIPANYQELLCMTQQNVDSNTIKKKCQKLTEIIEQTQDNLKGQLVTEQLCQNQYQHMILQNQSNEDQLLHSSAYRSLNSGIEEEKIQNFDIVPLQVKVQYQNQNLPQQQQNLQNKDKQQIIKEEQKFNTSSEKRNYQIEKDQKERNINQELSIEAKQRENDIKVYEDLKQHIKLIEQNIDNKDVTFELTDIGSGFFQQNQSTDSIKGLAQQGIRKKVEVKKKDEEFSFFGSIVMAVLGIAQVVVGGVIVAYSGMLGSQLGLSILIEGITDVLTACSSMYSKTKIDWAQYGINKAINYSIAMISVGTKGIKEAKDGLVKGTREGIQWVKKGVQEGMGQVKTLIQDNLNKETMQKMGNNILENGKRNKSLLRQVQSNYLKTPLKGSKLDLITVQNIAESLAKPMLHLNQLNQLEHNSQLKKEVSQRLNKISDNFKETLQSKIKERIHCMNYLSINIQFKDMAQFKENNQALAATSTLELYKQQGEILINQISKDLKNNELDLVNKVYFYCQNSIKYFEIQKLADEVSQKIENNISLNILPKIQLIISIRKYLLN